jgi:long-chain fatty acid transport protein
MSFSHQINDKYTFGLGVNVPFGMITKYDSRWSGADHGATSKVTSVTTTPLIAYKATDKLSLGAGLPIQYFKARLTSTGAYGTAGVAMEGDTIDVGYQLSALYELSDKTRFGVNYRSEINHKLKGEIESPNMPSSYNPIYNQDITARIDTPALFSVGAYHEINDKWAVMAEYQKVFWNSFDSIDIYGQDTTKAGSYLISKTPENWEDANFYSLGASYNVNDQWKIRAGIAYDESAVRIDYRTPRIPDSRRMWYSAGVGYKYNENLSFDAAYTFIKARPATVDLPTEGAKVGYSADYKNQVQIIGFSMNYKF